MKNAKSKSTSDPGDQVQQVALSATTSKWLSILPDEIRGYVEPSEEKPGSPEWFQDAFHAIASCTTDNVEYLADEFTSAFSNGFEDEDKLMYAVEEMKKEAGLDSM